MKERGDTTHVKNFNPAEKRHDEESGSCNTDPRGTNGRAAAKNPTT